MVAIAYLCTFIALHITRYADCSADVTAPEQTLTPPTPDGSPSDNIKDVTVAVQQNNAGEAAEKKELAKTGEKLDEITKETKASQEVIDKISKEQEYIKEKVGHKELDRVKELIAKKKELLKKIASIGKTLRVEHDARFPHLIGKPIVVIAKNEDDTKRAANTLAHLEGLNDVMNKIKSPCASLERIRSAAEETKKRDKRNRFAVIQKTLDSMSAEERLNYDHKMIEHYEGIIQEIENGIAKANEEVASSWKNYTQ